MKPTKLLNLALIAVASLIATGLLVPFLIRNGYPTPAVPGRSNLTLGVIILVLAGLGWPPLRYRRELAKKLADPAAPHPRRLSSTYAVRVLALAKSSEIFGAIVAGGVGGILIAQATSPVGPGASFGSNLVSCMLAVVLAVLGYVIEQLLKIKDDADAEDGAGDTEAGKRPAVKTGITAA
jgi:hypothetical protein